MAKADWNQFAAGYLKRGKSMKEAAAAWRAQKGGGGGKRRSPARCESTIVPTRDGSGVTTRNGQVLRASFEGHVDVSFDQGALGAVWTGIVQRLRQSNSVNLAALFPEMFPDAAQAMQANRVYADQTETGRQMAPLLSAVLVAYGVTPEEWAGWYAAAVQGANYVIPKQGGAACISVGPALQGAMESAALAGLPAAAANQATQFGGVLGAPGGALVPAPTSSPFGVLR